MKCDVCGAQVENGKCPYCGKVFYDTSDQTGKTPVRISPSCGKNGPKNRPPKRKNRKFIIGVVAVICFIVIFSVIAGLNTPTGSSKATIAPSEGPAEISSTLSDEVTDTEDLDHDISTAEVTEEALPEEAGPDPISNFSYVLSGDEIIIHSYSGSNSTVEIQPYYAINDVEYKTNLTEFYAESNVKTWIFDEGITDINRGCFNGVHPENIFFPSTMETVYDNWLTVLNTGMSMVNIYFAGSEDEWYSILIHYDNTDFFDEDSAFELGQEFAEKLTHFLNADSYEGDHIIYHFNASPDDLKNSVD